MHIRGSIASPGGLAALYRDHATWLRTWIHRRLGNREQAADLAQATFCRLLEHGVDTLPRSPRSYLATVARRLLIDDLRRLDLEQAYRSSHVLLHGDRDNLTPERITAATQELHGLLQLLATLPAAVRRSLLLRQLDGLDHASIAARLGLSTRTVKRHVAQAYQALYQQAFAD